MEQFKDQSNTNQNSISININEGQEHIERIEPLDIKDHKINVPKMNLKHMKNGAIFFAAIALISGIISFNFQQKNNKVDTSDTAKQALTTRTSTDLAVGTQLLSKDDNYVGGDITLVHSSQDKENAIQVWDYAAVDGDYVQIKVNGSPITDSFMITHEPKTITVPTVGTVEVIGTKDGGGGITYAIRYGVNGMTYYNGTTEGNENKYTLIRQ
jgi:A2-5a orf9; hypothetical protein